MNDTKLTLAQLANDIAAQFAAQHGRQPRWIVAAPGRVNLIGEHTDYNDGFVLPMAIERYTVIAADRPLNGQTTVKWHSTNLKKTAEIAVDKPIERGPESWANYIRGVFAGFQARGVNSGPLDVVMSSNVPLGGGLSSSAAMEVATATLIETVTGHVMDPVDKALLCQKAEHDFANVPCGIMDQFTSALGRESHLLLLDCRSRKTELVPMNDPELAVLITNTNVKHELGNGEYAKRRKQCEAAAAVLKVASLRDATAEALIHAQPLLDSVDFRRAKHVISEIERTVHAAHCIRASNWQTVGQLMYASHFSLRDDYEVSCKELDVLVEIGQEIGRDNGMIGCRMTGGGFGGCTVSLVKAAAVPEISRRITETYKKRTGITPTLFVSRPAAGATVVKA